MAPLGEEAEANATATASEKSSDMGLTFDACYAAHGILALYVSVVMLRHINDVVVHLNSKRKASTAPHQEDTGVSPERPARTKRASPRSATFVLSTKPLVIQHEKKNIPRKS